MFKLPDREAKSRMQPIVEDIHFQRCSWMAERLAWICMFVVLVVAAFISGW